MVLGPAGQKTDDFPILPVNVPSQKIIHTVYGIGYPNPPPEEGIIHGRKL